MKLSTIEINGNVLIERKVILEGDIRICSSKGGSIPHYAGEYIITPKTYEQELATKSKMMTANVKVLKIPYVEVSNPYGTTVTIAEE